MLTRRDFSSAVVDGLCGQVRGQNATVACFYFDFAAENGQSHVNMLGCLLKQLVFGLKEIPEEISEAYKDRKNALGGQGPQISDILKMLWTTSARKRAFICIDALDECATEHRVKLLATIRAGRDDINPDRPDKFGQTPLRLAARHRYSLVAELL